MATNLELVQNLYVAYFNRPGDQKGIDFYVDVLNRGAATIDQLSAAFNQSPEYTGLFAGKNSEQIVGIVYQNLFGRAPDQKGLAFWADKLDKKIVTVADVVKYVVAGAVNTDGTPNADAKVFTNKTAAAIAFSDSLLQEGNALAKIAYGSGDPVILAMVKAFIANVTDDASLAAATAGLPSLTEAIAGQNNPGQNANLTAGVDTLNGTAGNDVFTGTLDAGSTPSTTTLSALDTINGGAGNDTLVINVLSAAGVAGSAATLPTVTLSSVETVNLRAAVGVDGDVSTWNGVNTVNVSQIAKSALADALKLKAAATTDVNVKVSAVGDTIKVDGGKNVNVSLNNVATADVVTVTGAKAAVTVSNTGAASVAGTAATLAAVNVTGGSTITVTQKATSDASAAATDGTGATITQGKVTIVGDASTATVVVKQDTAVQASAATAATTAKATTKEVVFTAAAKGDIVTIDFGDGALSFQANKALTAAEVASAFANLAKNVKQGSASAALGIYSDLSGGVSTGVSDGWTSGAVQTVDATHAKVVFSSAVAAADLTIATGGAIAVAQNRVAGATGAGAAAGVLGVANGIVDIQDSAAASIKTITVDGYADTSVIGTTGATASLATLNLSNAELKDAAGADGILDAAAGITVGDTAATLALKLEKVGTSVYYDGQAANTVVKAGLSFTAAPTTLNVNSVGDNYVALTAAATETLNVSGTGTLDVSANDLAGLKSVKVTEKAGLVLNAAVADTVESVDTTGTTGTVSVSIEGNRATYTGGAGVDNVTVTNSDVAISKAINLGAGNDTLDLSQDLTVDPTVELNGGDGVDTIILSAAAAAARSAASTFETKITGFEKLGITAATSNYTVDMTNMDDINYVVSANSTVGATPEVQTFSVTSGVAAVKTNATQTLNFAGTAITVNGNITVGGVTVAVVTTDTASDIATKVVTALNGQLAGGSANAVKAAAVGSTVTFTIDTRDGALASLPVVATTATATGLPATATAGIAFNANAQTITIGGVAVNLVAGDIDATGAAVAGSGDDTAAEVATKIVSALDAATATYDAAGTSNAGAAVTVKYAANGNQANITLGATTSGVAIGAVTEATPGTAGTAGLIIDKLANKGTLELTAAGAGVEVKILDAATGTADVLNIVTNAATGANLGTVTANKVETINVSANDTDVTTSASGAAKVSTNTLTLAADKAATINVSGAGNVVLKLDASSTAVTLIDGSTATGKLTVTTLAGDAAATTVKGGAGADVLTAQGANDVLIGGAGTDTLKVVGLAASAVTLTGGDGVDSFDVSGFLAANAGAAVTITDLAKGETIKFVSDVNLNFASSKVALIPEATFDNYVTEAAKAAGLAAATHTGTPATPALHGIAWFQFGSNTFIVQDNGGSAGVFDNATDIIVKLTGTVDLSNSSINDVGQGTLQFL
ncbi:DUF4214 domain-containing protein [Pseudoduganella violacea]|uniref:DUF4214 domain-containing protein n=1 Tax=Pseudoduganella violacea TaxID=1715466 RepID=A0A7W5FSY2_9BURK|nr:DUF4214 domain-containing protein [Pseudoduganella violacea]MBB3118057.1 hypothetical protein [Pseudoduganella violacea]